MAILGESFKDYVRKQINVRQDRLSLGNRDDDTLKYITSKTSFLRLSSGIDISGDVAKNLGVIGYEGSLLAKKYVLFSSNFDNQFTSGVGYSLGSFNASYGFNSDIDFGLVPPPGLTMATVNTLNRGTIREATINLVCHNLYQFKIINALFLKLKYSLLLEWGHTLYFNNDNSLSTAIEIPNLSTSFLEGMSSDKILNQIELKRKESSGNYDAFFGVVKNFNWELQENGSYNVTINAISQGDVIESLKVNSNLKPDDNASGNEPQYQKSSFHKILGDITKKIADGPDGPGGTYQGYLHGYKTSDTDIALNTDSISSFTGLTPGYKDPKDNNTFGSSSILANNEGLAVTFPNLQSDENGAASPQYYIKLGTLLRIMESFLLYYDTDKKEENGSHPSIFYINHDFAANECLTTPRQISADPLTCLIPIDFDSESGGSDPSIVYFYKLITNTHAIPLNPNGTAQSRTITNSTSEELPDPPQNLQENVDVVISSESSTNDPLSLIIDNQTTLNEAINIINANAAALATPNGQTITLITKVFTKTTQAAVNNESQAGNLKYVENGFRSGYNKNIGKTMHIYVNINKIIEVLDSNIDGDGNVAVYNFLTQLLGEISSALCSINKFSVDYDEATNSFSIIDTAVFPIKYQNLKKDDIAKFNINLLTPTRVENGIQLGGGSFVTNFGLKSEVFGQISNAIAIGSQANGNTMQSNSTPISEFNTGLTDRIMTNKTNPNVVIDSGSGFAQYPEARTKYEQFKVRISNPVSGSSITPQDIDLYKSFLVDLMNLDLGTYTENAVIPGTGFIPLNLQLTMDGLSGIRQYQTFNIDETLLPNEYYDKLKFITTTVTHKIDTKGWETTISSLGVPKTNKDPKPVDQNIPKLEIKTQTQTETKKTVEISGNQANVRAKYGEPGDNSNIVSWTPPYTFYYSANRVANGNAQVLKTLKLHKDVVSQFTNAFTEVLTTYGLEQIQKLGLNTTSGTYVVRANRNDASKYSLHSWGIAIDMLAGENPNKGRTSKTTPPATFSTSEYTKFVNILEKHGLYSLGKYKDKDWMHFQTWPLNQKE